MVIVGKNDERHAWAIRHSNDARQPRIGLVEWLEPPFFQGRYKNLFSQDELKALGYEYQKYDRLFEQLSVTGFKPASYGVEPMRAHIRPQGEFYWTIGGNHRLGMAIVLDAILSVQVLTRHREWQFIREKFAEGEGDVVEKYRNHPDLQEFLEMRH